MKKFFSLILTTCIVLLPTACSKDSPLPAAAQPLLTRISLNGVTLYELQYDHEKRLIRSSYHYNGDLNSYMLYEYDALGIKERRVHSVQHDLVSKTVYTLDNVGRVIKAENFFPSGNLGSTLSYSYNTSGQLASKDFKPANESVLYRENYTYNDQGHLIQSQRTDKPNQVGVYLSSQYDYIPRNTPLPYLLEDLNFLLSVSPGGNIYIFYMRNTTTHRQSWHSHEQLLNEYIQETSNLEYNAQGYVTRLVLTQLDIHPGSNESEEEITYEYAD